MSNLWNRVHRIGKFGKIQRLLSKRTAGLYWASSVAWSNRILLLESVVCKRQVGPGCLGRVAATVIYMAEE